MKPFLEQHNHNDPLLPIYFHKDHIPPGRPYAYLHWHENIEILYVCEGKVGILSNTEQIEADAGDIVIINSNHIHAFSSINDAGRYYCLIVDKNLCDSFGIHVSEILFQNKLRDPKCVDYFLQISNEIDSKLPLYQAKVKSIMMNLFVRLYREYLLPPSTTQHSNIQKLETIKIAIAYINEHFTERLTIDQICAKLGFSKYYFCHMFREITNQTVVDYINYVRCLQAKILIISGKLNVSEAAQQCGFNNFSYFAKQYKKHMGTLPSKELKLQDS